jgi:hypothetical protein
MCGKQDIILSGSYLPDRKIKYSEFNGGKQFLEFNLRLTQRM